jgi:hypothetical protein
MRRFQKLSLPTFQHRKQNDDEDSNNDAFTKRKRKALDHGYSFAVIADRLKAFAVGDPGEPGLRIFSPDPEAMRLRLAWMFSYRPPPLAKAAGLGPRSMQPIPRENIIAWSPRRARAWQYHTP